MSYHKYIDKSKVKKILVIKLRHFGDVLLSTPVLHVLKKSIPDAEIDAFVYKESFDILKNNLNVSKIFTYDRGIKKLGLFKRLRRELKILLNIKKQKYDLVINLTEGDRGAIIAFFSKALYKVGFDPGREGFFKKDKIYTHLVKNAHRPRHAVEKNLDVLRRIGIFAENIDKKLEFNISKEVNETVKKILKDNDLVEGGYILIHPTSRWRFKIWDKFDQLIDALIQKNQKIVIVSGKDGFEIDMVNKIIKDKPIINLAGKISIEELAKLIDFSRLLICNDSLAFHIASVLKANSLAFFGPTCDITWGAWQNPNGKVLKSNHSCRPCFLDGCGGSKKSECLTDISIESILQKINLQVFMQKNCKTPN